MRAKPFPWGMNTLFFNSHVRQSYVGYLSPLSLFTGQQGHCSGGGVINIHCSIDISANKTTILKNIRSIGYQQGDLETRGMLSSENDSKAHRGTTQTQQHLRCTDGIVRRTRTTVAKDTKSAGKLVQKFRNHVRSGWSTRDG